MKKKDLYIFDCIYINNKSKPSDEKHKENIILDLVDLLKEDGFGKLINQLQFIGPLVLDFKDASKTNEMVCND